MKRIQLLVLATLGMLVATALPATASSHLPQEGDLCESPHELIDDFWNVGPGESGCGQLVDTGEPAWTKRHRARRPAHHNAHRARRA